MARLSSKSLPSTKREFEPCICFVLRTLTIFDKFTLVSNRYLPVPTYPTDYTQSPFRSCSAHFSAVEFFRDTPWLNVPHHRRADILVEPLYPRLGLLGGASQEGKMSKLAALAAARKKKTSEKPLVTEREPVTQADEQKPAPRSLSERLAMSGPRSAVKSGGLSALSKERRTTNLKSPPINTKPEDKPTSEPSMNQGRIEQAMEKQKPDEPTDLRAHPSTFAATIVGNRGHHRTPEPGPLLSSNFDIMSIYQQDVTEAFDFAGPSPDDIVFNAQSASKGLPIRGSR